MVLQKENSQKTVCNLGEDRQFCWRQVQFFLASEKLNIAASGMEMGVITNLQTFQEFSKKLDTARGPRGVCI